METQTQQKTSQEGSNFKPKYSLRKFDKNVKFQYEMIDLYESAKEANINQLCHMIQEAKEEIGKQMVVAKLEYILNKKIYGLEGKI